MAYKLKIEPEASKDIQDAIDWYDQQQPSLGRKFHLEVKLHFKKLAENPFYQVRYDEVRGFVLRKFPYMIHFTVSESERIIVVRAVFNTSRDPEIWKDR